MYNVSTYYVTYVYTFMQDFSFRITRCFPVCCLDLNFFFWLYTSDFEMLTNGIGRSNFFLLFGMDSVLGMYTVLGTAGWIMDGWMDGWIRVS